LANAAKNLLYGENFKLNGPTVSFNNANREKNLIIGALEIHYSQLQLLKLHRGK